MHSKGNHQQNKKANYHTGEDICKWYDQKGVNIQNVKISHATQTQYPKEKQNTSNLIKKWKEKLNIFPKNTKDGF